MPGLLLNQVGAKPSVIPPEETSVRVNYCPKISNKRVRNTTSETDQKLNKKRKLSLPSIQKPIESEERSLTDFWQLEKEIFGDVQAEIFQGGSTETDESTHQTSLYVGLHRPTTTVISENCIPNVCSPEAGDNITPIETAKQCDDSVQVITVLPVPTKLHKKRKPDINSKSPHSSSSLGLPEVITTVAECEVVPIVSAIKRNKQKPKFHAKFKQGSSFDRIESYPQSPLSSPSLGISAVKPVEQWEESVQVQVLIVSATGTKLYKRHKPILADKRKQKAVYHKIKSIPQSPVSGPSLAISEVKKPYRKEARKGTGPVVWPSRTSLRLRRARKRMLNGYNNGSADNSPSSDVNSYPPIATLGNLGNTCFLNSVLYTLRFTPNFVHNVHHLVSEINEVITKQEQIKAKTASLGRNMSAGKSWTSPKEMLSISPATIENVKSKLQIMTEKLHSLFESLHLSEVKETGEPFQAEDYLKSLRDVNSYFVGNQQHDAHEFLVCLFNNIQETIIELGKLKSELILMEQELEVPGSSPPPLNNSKSWGGVRKSWKRKKEKNLVESKVGDASGLDKAPDSDIVDTVNGIMLQMPLISIEEDSQNSTISQESCSSPKEADVPVDSFIVKDFQGLTILNTTCLECEKTSLRKEVFSEIGVSVPTERKDDDNMSDDSSSSKTVSEVYQTAIVTTEYLRDLNKYWCEICTRYNEAKRSVQYETLPKILILQLKRFASNINSMTKINDHMPTPLTLACFCTECCALPEEKRPHKYQLYSVIMHLGQAIASGHYVSYVRATEDISTYVNCQRDKHKSTGSCVATAKTGNCDKMGGFFRFFKAKSSPESSTKSPNVSNSSNSYPESCRGMDCCGVRLSRSLLDQIQNGTLSSKRKDTKDQVDTSVPEPVWLECDDENVRPLTVLQFEDLLAPKSSLHSGQTPYLLFYCRTPLNGTMVN